MLTLANLRQVVARFSRNRTSAPAGSLNATLARVIADLQRLNGSTERDFLTVGGQLNEIVAESREVAGSLEALVDLLSGAGSDELKDSLARASASCDAEQHHAAEADESLTDLRRHSRGAREASAEIIDAVRTFRVIGTMTRIETARLGTTGADFTFLTSEVEHLTESIEANVARVVEVNEQLMPRIEEVLKRIGDRDAAEIRALPQMIRGLESSLSALDDHRVAAVSAVHRLHDEYQAITGAVEEMVVSLQFQDITRQQVEHVIEALEHIQGDTGLQSDPGLLQAALTLQNSQLVRSRELFVDSVQTIETNLNQVVNRTQAMTREVADLFGSSSRDGDSFLDRLGHSLASMVRLGEDAAAGLAADILRNLEASVIAMREPVEQIGAIEIQMQRIAMNTQVGAAHLGETGEPLGRLAAGIQEMAVKSRRNYLKASEVVQAMSAGTERLRTLVGSTTDGAAVFAEMRSAAGQMSASNIQVHETLAAVEARCTALSQRLIAAAQMEARRHFEEIAAACVAAIEQLGGVASPEAIAGSLESLSHFASKYTMQYERDVHTGLASSSAAAESTAAVHEEFGEGVELF